MQGTKEKKEQAYYTVYVYKFSGLGCEETFENVLAESEQNAIERIVNSHQWLKYNPMYAYKQDKRM